MQMAFYICSMTTTRIALFASGTGSNARRIMEYFAEHNRIEVGLLLANKADAGALQHAAECGIPHHYLPNEQFRQGAPVVELLHEYRIDAIVLAGFLLLIPPALIAAYPHRIVNIHPALLPNYGGKGMYGHFVHEAVAAAGEQESGITIHIVTEAYDEGPVLAQHRVGLTSEDDARTIESKVRRLELEHYAQEIEHWILQMQGLD